MEKRKVTLDCSDSPSLTQQHLKQQCDVNSILEKYRKTGQITHIKKSPGMYGDFSKYQDFRSNLDVVAQAQQSFMALPAHLRKKFGNDPAQLVEFLDDPQNYDAAAELGFVVKSKNEAPNSDAPKNDDKTTINAQQSGAAT